MSDQIQYLRLQRVLTNGRRKNCIEWFNRLPILIGFFYKVYSLRLFAVFTLRSLREMSNAKALKIKQTAKNAKVSQRTQRESD